MNELRHDYVYYDYDYVMFMLMIEPMYDMFKNKSTRCYMTSIRHGIEQVKNMIPMTILGFP